MDTGSGSDITLYLNSSKNSEFEDNVERDDSIQNSEEYNRKLQSRILSLRETIRCLKDQLQEERGIWQKEMVQKNPCYEPQNRMLPVSYDYYQYDHDMQRYQDVILKTHYESRQNLQKQIEFANYKRRLIEVEHMCTLELLRVKQSVQILQPLQMMVAEWNLEIESGDSIRNPEQKLKYDIKREAKEVSMPLETVLQNACPCIETVSEPFLNESNKDENLGENKQSHSQPTINTEV